MPIKKKKKEEDQNHNVGFPDDLESEDTVPQSLIHEARIKQAVAKQRGRLTKECTCRPD